MGPVWMAIVLIAPEPEGMSEHAWITAGIALLMATWWITEALPIPATALLPLVLFPVFGVGPMAETAAPYANSLIFLFMGGFLIALAMVRWGLHKRIALQIVTWAGTGPRALIAGFMVATAFLSMWVSNTATALMMLPVGLSVISVVDDGGSTQSFKTKFSLALLLGIAFSANIGGMGTLIGTPPNAFIAAYFEAEFGYDLTFLDWMLIGIPIVAVGIPLTLGVLTYWMFPLQRGEVIGSQSVIDQEIASLGPLSKGEIAVSIVFAITALLWITRPLLASYLPGLTDAGIAMAGGLSLFLIPVDFRRGIFVQDWNTAKQLPWGALILIGGGLSLASMVTRSGLADWIGASLSFVASLPVIVIILIVAGLIVYLTELTSNTATTATFVPVLAALALGVDQNPLLFAIPAALAASCAFMLPVATPPNAIVYGSGRVSVPQMARTGSVLNPLFLILITGAGYLLILWTFDVQLGAVPMWAR